MNVASSRFGKRMVGFLAFVVGASIVVAVPATLVWGTAPDSTWGWVAIPLRVLVGFCFIGYGAKWYGQGKAQ